MLLEDKIILLENIIRIGGPSRGITSSDLFTKAIFLYEK